MNRTHFITPFVARLSGKQAIEVRRVKISGGVLAAVRRGYFDPENEEGLLCSQPQQKEVMK